MYSSLFLIHFIKTKIWLCVSHKIVWKTLLAMVVLYISNFHMQGSISHFLAISKVSSGPVVYWHGALYDLRLGLNSIIRKMALAHLTISIIIAHGISYDNWNGQVPHGILMSKKSNFVCGKISSPQISLIAWRKILPNV